MRVIPVAVVLDDLILQAVSVAVAVVCVAEVLRLSGIRGSLLDGLLTCSLHMMAKHSHQASGSVCVDSCLDRAMTCTLHNDSRDGSCGRNDQIAGSSCIALFVFDACACDCLQLSGVAAL